MTIKQFNYLKGRFSTAIRILKMFEDAPVLDASLIAERLGIAKSSAYNISINGLNLPRLNIRDDKRTYFFITDDYMQDILIPLLQHSAEHSDRISKLITDTFLPVNLLVESFRDRPNYLIRHDYRVSQVLFALSKIKEFGFSPVSIRLATQFGNFEPDILTYRVEYNENAVVMPIIFEIVNTRHNVKNYFPELFRKYMEIAEESRSLTAHVVFAIEQDLNAVIKAFNETFKDIHGIKSVVKKKAAYELKAGPLTVYLWRLKDIDDSSFVSTVQSECDFMESTRQEITFSIPVKQHIKRFMLDLDTIFNA